MSNMKFAIQKLAVTCLLPASLLTGLATESQAQQVPSAVSKANAGLPVRIPARRKPTVAPATAPLDQSPTSKTILVRQATNGQQQMRTGNTGESDVQRQLRMLYEKNGQEMPAMSLEELEVPEPQPGVAPGSSPEAMMQPGQGAGQGQMYNTAPQPKAPNFFERVFLGKKAPPPAAPRPMLQRPQAAPVPQQQRPPQNYGGVAPDAGQSRPNYRPYQGGQPGVMNQPMPAAQIPPQTGYYGQRPTPQSQVIPPAAPVATVQPQQNAPAQANSTQLPVLQAQPAVQPAQPLPRLDSPAAVVPPQRQPKAQPQPATDDVPVLSEEPEESLEIDLTPKNPATSTPAADSAVNATPSKPTESQEEAKTEEAKPDATPSTVAEENPFSGLKLNVPESSEPKSPGTSSGIGTSPAANAIRSVIPANQPTLKQEATTPRTQNGPSLEKQAPATSPRTTTPRKTTPQATSPRTTSAEKKPAQPSIGIVLQTNGTSPENLKKLADASEKLGLKGFCCVALRQQRQLLETKPQFNATHQGQKYYFSSIAAKKTFEQSPELFIPLHKGQDAVALIDDEEKQPGILDFGAWYQGRLYLFANRENLETFKESPEIYAEDGDEEDLTTLTGGVAGNDKTTPRVAKVAGEKHAAPPPATRPSAFDSLPVLTDDLNSLEPIAPPAELTGAATTPTPTQQSVPPNAGSAAVALPDLTPKEEVKTQPVTTTPRATQKPAAQQPVRKAPPKLISPDLRLAPPKNGKAQ